MKSDITGPVFVALIKFFTDICNKVSVKYDHLLILLKLKENTSNEDIPDIKEVYLKFKEYLDKNRDTGSNLKKLLPELKDQSNKLDYVLDLFINIYQFSKSAKFYHSHSKKIDEIYKFIEFYKNRKKEPIDEIEEDCISNDFDIYDLSQFEAIFSALRKDGFSQEYLDNLNLEDIFLLYYQFLDRSLVESSRMWFRDKLRDIEMKVNEKVPLEGSDKKETRERTPEEKQILNDELEKEYFISDKDLKNET